MISNILAPIPSPKFKLGQCVRKATDPGHYDFAYVVTAVAVVNRLEGISFAYILRYANATHPEDEKFTPEKDIELYFKAEAKPAGCDRDDAGRQNMSDYDPSAADTCPCPACRVRRILEQTMRATAEAGQPTAESDAAMKNLPESNCGAPDDAKVSEAAAAAALASANSSASDHF